MAKESGLGDNCYAAGANISGDVGSLSAISGGPALMEVTAIDKSAMERLGGLRTGTIDFTAFFNTTVTHPTLSTLPTTDRRFSYFHGTAIGNVAASMVAKQIGYDPTRAADGSLTMNINAVSNGFGIEWGQQLTAGLRTDTGATNGTSLDTGGSLSFGGQAYMHTVTFSGTDITIKIQDSADNSSFADVAGFSFTQLVSTGSERIALSNTATIRRYVRVATVTTGGFTSATFAVNLIKNELAGQVF